MRANRRASRVLPFESTRALFTLALAAFATACSAQDGEEIGATNEAISVKGSFVARGTGYYPSSSAMEGGFLDRKGAKLRTLQQYLAGQADYVSVAMDSTAFAYGQRLRIRQLEAQHGGSIVFRVVDTGGAFRGRGRSRIDVCVRDQRASLDPVINGRLDIDIIDEQGGPEPSDEGANDAGSGAAGSGSSAAAGAEASGPSCSSDGMCNPGNDGSGSICIAGKCVPGCKTNAQCPGAETCRAGQCA